jgi:formyl-CoA transferase
MTSAVGALAGVRVLDLSRVLAGPWASQLLGDLGAEVLKVERPGQGDDTRRWGPPFTDDGTAAYYHSTNRNKHALAIDFAREQGADLVRRLAQDCDVLLENFRPGGLARYGLDYASLAALNPRLIYCSVTGFGQTGPYRERGGYDFLVQGMGGLMSVTGLPDRECGSGPMKVGVPVTDLFTGMYAATSILAALVHQRATGRGQHIDSALLDTQVAMLANQGSAFLNSGQVAPRLGNAHPVVVPYRDFEARDGTVLVALGNDRQFLKLCALLDLPDLAADPRFATNAQRHANRTELEERLAFVIAGWNSADFLDAMEREGLPAGPINHLDQVFADPQVEARAMVERVDAPGGKPVPLVRYPHLLSETPASIRKTPPAIGEDTRATLHRLLELDEAALDALTADGVIA